MSNFDINVDGRTDGRKIGRLYRIPSIIPRHRNYLFMFQSYHCENVVKENDGGTDNNPKLDLKISMDR